MTEVTYFILLSLDFGPKHGYAVMKEVEELSQGRVTLSTGTLYGAFKRLLDLGWIERTEDPDPDDTARVRKAYRLSKLGCQVLDAEVQRLRGLVAAARLRSTGSA